MNDFSVVKISAKGQITLPAKIRKNLKTRNLIVFENKNSIELQPLEIQKSAVKFPEKKSVKKNSKKSDKKIPRLSERSEKNLAEAMRAYEAGETISFTDPEEITNWLFDEKK